LLGRGDLEGDIPAIRRGSGMIEDLFQFGLIPLQQLQSLWPLDRYINLCAASRWVIHFDQHVTKFGWP
jgi:hypothetical protein